jgi:Leucine-rich repeat (LRR) protein
MSTITVEKRKKGHAATTKLIERIEECEKSGQYKLDVSHLGLSELPFVEISVLPRISVLLGFGNQLVSMPPLNCFRALTTIDISRNCLTDISDMRLSQLHHLNHLDLSRNQLRELPVDLCKLPVLETLIVHRNLLTELPSEISHVKALTSIDASYNHIQYIGATVETLPRLEFLNLDFQTPDSNNGARSSSDAAAADGTVVAAELSTPVDNSVGVGRPISNPLMVDIGTRTRRLLERHALLVSKDERRSLIQRALGVRRNVLQLEEKAIVEEQLKQTYSRPGTLVDEYP